jgi:cell division protein FtsB/energy-coupling factor transporter ATP-binding protein EcfA2
MTALSKAQPYPGLRPFDSGDEEFFFGREAQTRGLRTKLDSSHLVAVVGRSGCGKSSLARAGLVPLLNGERDGGGQQIWHIASFRPQGRPIAELTSEMLRLSTVLMERDRPGASNAPGPLQTAASMPPNVHDELRRSRLDAMLRRSSRGLVEAATELALPSWHRLLIIVDQFEEIFRFEDPRGSDADEPTAFVRLLVEAANADSPQIHVLLTMRLDFLGDCARFPRLPEAISDGQFLVPNLSRAERRAAIEEPARKCGKAVRPEVTQRLLNEIGDDPDQLPVLQHVLMRMWQQAGDKTEITLSNYDDTGGVAAAISRHADQIYDALQSAGDRRITEQLFKAISERDRRGRSIRRATPLATLENIVAGNSPPAAGTANSLRHVIEAYRAPDSCFLMPPAGEDLTPDTLIDISHESLLRGWGKLTGVAGKEGWIAEEERDGRTYRSLLEATENGSTLSNTIARQRQQWWSLTEPSAAWAERYGNKFATVEEFVRSSSRRAKAWTVAIIALIVVAVIPSIGFGAYYSYAKVQQNVEREADATARKKLTTAYDTLEQERATLAREYDALTEENRTNLSKLKQAQDKIQAQEKALLQRSRDVDGIIRQAQSVAPLNEAARRDLDNLLKASPVAGDNALQRAYANPKKDGDAATLPTADTGFMWIGSAQDGNLNTLTGDPVLPVAVKVNGEYLTDLDIYLRQGLPERAAYTQQPIAAIMPEGTRVKILSIPPPFARPTGEQTWAQVRVVKYALSTVYFQYAGGTRIQAQQVSKALQDKGYKIPGEERTVAAAGQREVRYFNDDQKSIAAQLATDATQMLRQLGNPSPAVTAKLAGAPTRNNADGKLELWLDIPPK